MELLAKITDFEASGMPVTKEVTFERTAARAVLFDENGKVPILFVSKYSFHKLPGGGVEKDEDIPKALERECMEELGCTVEVSGEVGMTEEIRQDHNMHQLSYCFIGKITKKEKEPDYTREEIEQGMKLVWMEIDEAIETLKKDTPNIYDGKFIQKRDIVLLEKARVIREGK